MAVMLSGESTIYHYYNAEKGLDNTASLKLENYGKCFARTRLDVSNRSWLVKLVTKLKWCSFLAGKQMEKRENFAPTTPYHLGDFWSGEYILYECREHH
jgi:hypothetical protein